MPIRTRPMQTGLVALLTLGAVSLTVVACSPAQPNEEPSATVSDRLDEIDYSEWYSLYEWDCPEDAAPDAFAPLPLPPPPELPTADAAVPDPAPDPDPDPGLAEAKVVEGDGGVRPSDKPRPPPTPPPPPKPACKPKPKPKCDGKNVPAAAAALCPPAKNVDRTDTVSCKEVPQANSNYSNAGKYWLCAGSPHHPCLPTATNGGNATHTHHDQERYNFNNGCCFYQKVKDVQPPTCAAP